MLGSQKIKSNTQNKWHNMTGVSIIFIDIIYFEEKLNIK